LKVVKDKAVRMSDGKLFNTVGPNIMQLNSMG